MISKVVIPVAGLGTRFLPFTKSVPKEMLPVVDAPSILLIVEEAYKAGITDIILVQGRGKVAIEDFFDVSYELEATLSLKNKESMLNRIRKIRDNVNIISVRQKVAMGLGHAILAAKPVVGDEPFAVMLGDELMTDHCELKGLIDNYETNGISTVSVMEVDALEVSKYGVIDIHSQEGERMKVRNLIEKPSLDKAPSLLALPGRYVFSPEIFKFLKETKPGVGGEIQLTDAMIELAKRNQLEAIQIKSKRYDLGDKFGFIKANIEFALNDPEIGYKVREYLQENYEHLLKKNQKIQFNMEMSN